jgi:hypothetical protein
MPLLHSNVVTSIKTGLVFAKPVLLVYLLLQDVRIKNRKKRKASSYLIIV